MNQLACIPAPEIEPECWPGETPIFDERSLDSLLTWAWELGASRIGLQTDRAVAIRLHGRVHKATRRPLSESDVEGAANRLYGADGVARLKSGQDFDISYEIRPDRRTRLRFRVNAVGVQSRGAGGVDIVLRPIPCLPPRLSEQRVEPGILAAYRPFDGMVLVGGRTGSGKSTLIGGMIREKLEDPDSHCDIVEGGAPIEFVYEDLDCPTSTIAQCEIPRDLPSFEAFIRNCMRKEPTDIVVAECRDGPTITAATQAAISGHLLTSTIHTNDCAATMQRIVSLCPIGERDALTVAVAQSLRLVVNQRLVRSTDGKRTALQEFLVFDRTLRESFLEAEPQRWPALARRALADHGQSFEAATHLALAEGRISDAVARAVLKDLGHVA